MLALATPATTTNMGRPWNLREPSESLPCSSTDPSHALLQTQQVPSNPVRFLDLRLSALPPPPPLALFLSPPLSVAHFIFFPYVTSPCHLTSSQLMWNFITLLNKISAFPPLPLSLPLPLACVSDVILGTLFSDARNHHLALPGTL